MNKITHAGIFSQDMIQWDADAADYLARVVIADGQALEPAVAEAVNDLFLALKDTDHPAPTTADHFAILSQFVPLVGARTLAGALVTLVDTMPSVTNTNFVSGDYNRKTGLKGDASTKWLSLGIAGDADAQDDSSMFCYVTTTPGSNSGLMGSNSNNDNAQRRLWGISVNHNTAVSQIVTNALGFRGVSRSLSTEYKYRVGGATSTVSGNSATPVSSNVSAFARNTNGTSPSDARLNLLGTGKSADLTYLDTVFTAYLAALNSAIP
jgi:hypothetical protein